MIFLIGTFGLNFPIFIFNHVRDGLSLRRRQVRPSNIHHGNRLRNGSSALRQTGKPGIYILFVGAAFFGFGFALSAIMPTYVLFGLTLIVIGMSAQTFTTTTISIVQLSTDPVIRGRVMAILLAVALGSTPLGAPFVGWIADRFGPRWALGVGVASSFSAASVAVYYLAKYRHLRLRINAGRPRFTLAPSTEVRV